MSQITEDLSGTVERVTFYSEASGFCVLKVKVPKMRELITVTGLGSQVHPGEYIDCVGHWYNDQEYGLQFRASKIETAKPQTKKGIEKYLGSGLIKGIGPGFAKRLLAHFGTRVFEIIEHTPEKLKQIPGIAQKRLDTITHAWEDQKYIRDIVLFLQTHGIGTARAVRIYKTYGQMAISKIQTDPYCLALDIRGIGFKSADQLALKLGTPKTSLLRIKAGVQHILQEQSGQGHCAIVKSHLFEKTTQLLEVPNELVEQSVEADLVEKKIIEGTIEGVACLFLKSVYFAEKGVAKQLSKLLRAKAAWMGQFNVEKALNWAGTQTGLLLSHSQQTAIRTVLSQKVVIITGGPGVGKTTLVNSILKILKQKMRHVLLCAPTGRAAKRLFETTQLEAKTLHRLLEYDPKTHQFIRNEKTPLLVDYLVIDETSMVDLRMMHCLLKALPAHCGLLLVGDVDQLPSVGAGRVLFDLIQSNVIPTVRLTEIFRQATRSQIIVNAHRINQGKMPLVRASTKSNVLSDFYVIDSETPAHTQQMICYLIKKRIPERFQLDPLSEIQVLSPMNRGGLGVRALNILLQSHLNPNAAESITRYGCMFSTGDKVLQMVNNYNKEVFNGDIGRIESINLEDQTLELLFDTRTIQYDFSELDEISLAYATSVHKAQGSEYPAVIIPLSMQHYTLLEKNLLYTGITRGRALVILLGQKKALRLAIKRTCSIKRLTDLTQKIQEEML